MQEVKPVPHKAYAKDGYVMLKVRQNVVQLQANVLDEFEVRAIGNHIIACSRNSSMELMGIEIFDKDLGEVFTELVTGTKVESIFGSRWKSENLVRMMRKWYDLCFVRE